MPSLPQDSPAGGLGTGFPVVRGPPSELIGFYITTYEAAFGKRPTGSPQKIEGWRVLGFEPPCERSIHPLLGVHTGSGYVTNNYSALWSLITPHVERQDTDVSTTFEDFKVFGRPDYQRILPQCVDEPECRYPTGFSFSRLRFGEVRPPKSSRENSTWSHCASPTQPDVPQKATELLGFTGTAPRSDLTLPEQPHDVGDAWMDSFPAMCSSTYQPAMGYPAPFAPPELQVGPKGVTTRKEPLTYSTIQNQYLINLSQLAPIAPGEFGEGCSPQEEWTPPSPTPPGFSRLVGADSDHLGTEIRGGHPDPKSQWLQHQQPPHQPVAHQ
ncbi:uncharacterized protein LOC131574834 isoform X1 [Poecile atricapillus]|uniref:uncharacterized protein LOC131574834 isoform X1 n=1 Tax=Poecile atricapillus TaxID=48891 RepID=UPI00273849C1|nr:uncharacterized protein LOC131574834 isoform X1 [Poecile atricapillus]